MKPSTRAAIHKQAKLMGYPVDKGVFQRASRSRGKGEFRPKLLMPFFHIVQSHEPVLDTPTHLSMMEGIRESLAQTGRILEDRVFKDSSEVAQICRRRRISGLLICQGLPYAWMKQLCSLVPVILINPLDHYPELKIDSVTINETRSTVTILDHLRSYGHRHVAWFGIWDKRETTSAFAKAINMDRTSDCHLFSHGLRYASWAEVALCQPGGKTMPLLFLERDWRTQSLNDVINAGLDQLLAMRPMPTAVVVASVPMAEEFIKVATERGIKVPEHLSLVCYGRTSSKTRVTGIDYLHRLLGRAAPELLERRLAMPNSVPVTLQLESKLYRGTTVAAPAGSC